MAQPTEVRRVLARNIRVALAEREKTVSAVADFAGVSAAHLYDVLGGRKAATVDFLERVSAALECEPWELLKPSGDGDVVPEIEAPAESAPSRKPRRVKRKR